MLHLNVLPCLYAGVFAFGKTIVVLLTNWLTERLQIILRCLDNFIGFWNFSSVTQTNTSWSDEPIKGRLDTHEVIVKNTYLPTVFLLIESNYGNLESFYQFFSIGLNSCHKVFKLIRKTIKIPRTDIKLLYKKPCILRAHLPRRVVQSRTHMS